MSFMQTIKTTINNEQKLLDFVGANSIVEYKNDNGFFNTTEAFNYIKDEYNKEVKRFNILERNATIINPLTNRKIKKYSILDNSGEIRPKYKDKIIFKNGELVKNTTIIALDTDNKEYAKFDIETVEQPFLQQKFGITVPLSAIVPNTTYANIEFKHFFNPDDNVVSNIKIRYNLKISEDEKMFVTTITDNFSGREIIGIPQTPVKDDEDLWDTPVLEFYKKLIETDQPLLDKTNVMLVSIDDISITSTLNNATMSISDMVLREQEPLKINNLFNEVIDTKYNHCIHDYLIERYPKYSTNVIKTLNNINDLYDWSVEKNLKLRAFDINGNIIKTNDPTESNRKKALNFIAYNNHLYPILNAYLKKVKINNYKIQIVKNAKDKLIEYLESGILPTDINIDSNNEIYSFIINNGEKKSIMFLENDEYSICLDILEKFGLKDKMNPSTKLKNMGGIIENLYKLNDTTSNSFFPMGREFNAGGYNYNNEDLETSNLDLLYTIDKNKAYAYILSKLPYLIVCDIKYNKHRQINEVEPNHKIIPHYLYTVDIDNSTIILPNNNMFEGNTLIKAREFGLKFRIIQEQETSKIKNYLKDMVNDLYNKVDNDSFKKIINVFIGKFECSNSSNTNYEFDKIINGDELKTYTGFTEKINENYYIGMKTNQSVNVYNRKPISIQIKDRSRLLMYDMMHKLGLNNKDIKQVKTDSITFIKHNDEVDKYLHKEFSGWKVEEYKKINNPPIIKRKINLSFEYKNYNETGTIALGDAGNGKTTTIKNIVIPQLIKEKKSYIVLSPSHATIIEYRQNNLNCDVVQKYLYKILPVEEVIIVDEIGMICVAGWNMLYKCKMLGKDIRVYGDMGQLSPVDNNGKMCDNENFWKLMFKKHITLNHNYRNNFTKEYYNTLKTKYTEISTQEIKKYNTPYHKAEVIIAYQNATRKKYNMLMCKKLEINNLWDSGAKIICKTNKLAEYNIYNNFCFIVDKIVGDTIHFNCGTTLPLKELKKKCYFDYSYARTLYSVQGQSLNNFYYALEDISYLNGRGLYTLISRLIIK